MNFDSPSLYFIVRFESYKFMFPVNVYVERGFSYDFFLSPYYFSCSNLSCYFIIRNPYTYLLLSKTGIFTKSFKK